jgi:hypothetical protein
MVGELSRDALLDGVPARVVPLNRHRQPPRAGAGLGVAEGYGPGEGLGDGDGEGVTVFDGNGDGGVVPG